MPGKHQTNRIRIYPLLAAKVLPYQKAIGAGAAAGLAALLGFLGDGVTSTEWWQIIAAAAAGSGLVYAVPNKDPKGKKQRESVQPPDGKITHGSGNMRVRRRLDDKGIR